MLSLTLRKILSHSDKYCNGKYGEVEWAFQEKSFPITTVMIGHPGGKRFLFKIGFLGGKVSLHVKKTIPSGS